MPADVPGIHHVTAITSDVQKNVDFYVGVLGLRFIKKTVNFDVPDTYHLYFGDLTGTPGTAMTFFGWPHLPWGPPGTGQVSAVAFAIPGPSLAYWRGRLREHGIDPSSAETAGGNIISFKDPDGILVQLVDAGAHRDWQGWPESPVPEANQIRGFHSVGLFVRDAAPSAAFLTEVMGFRPSGGDATRLRFETGEGGSGGTVELLVDPEAPTAEEATGTVHHVAWRASGEELQLAWRDELVRSGRQVTPVIDRKYFRSIYFREPGGVLFEIATDRPGFTVDETVKALGSELQLPPQYEHRRDKLDFNLPSLVVPSFGRFEAGRT